MSILYRNVPLSPLSSSVLNLSRIDVSSCIIENVNSKRIGVSENFSDRKRFYRSLYLDKRRCKGLVTPCIRILVRYPSSNIATTSTASLHCKGVRPIFGLFHSFSRFSQNNFGINSLQTLPSLQRQNFGFISVHIMTRKVKTGARWTPFPPHCSGGTSYRVLIPTTPASKIRAIAKYKRLSYLKKTMTQEKDEMIIRDAENTIDEGSSAQNVTDRISIPCDAGNNSNTVSGNTPSSLDLASQKLTLQTPSIGTVIPANKMQSVSDESIHRELIGIDRNFMLVRKEMNSLVAVRMSLLWLLKKSTQLEIATNHSAPVFATPPAPPQS